MVQDMTKGSPRKLIFFFAVPLIIGNIFQQLYSMVDTIIVGRFVSVDALAAVGSTGALSFLILGFAQGVTSGFTIVTAQRFGAGDTKGVKRSVYTSVILSVIITVILTAISFVTARPLLHLMNTPANIIEDAALYIQIIYGGIFATVYYNLIASILRALGDSKTPLYFLFLSSALNIGLDLLFIIQFNWGVAGAAAATVISQLVSAVLCTVYSLKRYEILHLTKEDCVWEKSSVFLHLRVGLPMAFQFSVTAIGVMVLQGALNVFGSTVIAAFTAASKVENLVTQPFYALGIAMATYCGQNLGAGKIQRIRRGMWEAAWMGVAFCVLAISLNVFGGRFFTQMFMTEQNQQVFYYSQHYLNIIAVCYPLLMLLFLFRNALQGMGQALVPVLGGLGEFLARLLAALFLPGILGYTGVCLASPMAWIAAVSILVLKYVSLMRKYKKAEAANLQSA